MDTKEAPIIPVKQALIALAGYQFLVVQLPDGRITIVFSYLCRALHIDRRSQTRRIQEHPLLAEYLVTVQIKTTKGERVVNALVVWALSGWLSGFQIARLSEEQRALILALQRETFDTFVRPFFPETREQPQSASPKEEPAQVVPPKEEPGTLPPPPESPVFPPLGDEKRYAYQEYMFLAHDGLERHLRDIDAYLMTLIKQIAQMGQVVNQHAEILDEHIKTLLQHKELLEQLRQHLHTRPDGSSDEVSVLAQQVRQLREQVNALAAQVTRLKVPNPLTAEHQVEMRTLLRVLEHQTGQPASAIERELAAAFSVETISQLPEASWGEVGAWLHQRLGWSV